MASRLDWLTTLFKPEPQVGAVLTQVEQQLGLSAVEKCFTLLRVVTFPPEQFLPFLDELYAHHHVKGFDVKVLSDLQTLNEFYWTCLQGEPIGSQAQIKAIIEQQLREALTPWREPQALRRLLIQGLNPLPVCDQRWRQVTYAPLCLMDDDHQSKQAWALLPLALTLERIMAESMPEVVDLCTQLDQTSQYLRHYLLFKKKRKNKILVAQAPSLHPYAMVQWAIHHHHHQLAIKTIKFFPELLSPQDPVHHPLFLALEERDRYSARFILAQLTHRDRTQLLDTYRRAFGQTDALKLATYRFARATLFGPMKVLRFLRRQIHNVVRFRLENIFLEAVLSNNVERLLHAVSLGVECDIAYSSYPRNFYEQTPLIMAVYKGHLSTVKVLLGLGARVNQVMDRAETPLTIAAYNNRLLEAHALILAGGDPNQGNDADETPLIAAVKKHHLSLVEFFIQMKVDLNHRTRMGETALTIAAANGFSQVVSVLLQAGVDPNQGNWMGETALICAIRKRQYATLALLLDYIDIQKTDLQGNTALMWAVREQDYKLASLCLQKGAAVDLCDHNGDTPLCVAAKLNSLDLVHLLLQAGAAVNHLNFTQNTPLIIAAFHGQVANVDLLLAHHAKAEHCNLHGNSALHLAVRANRFEVVKRLLTHQRLMHHKVAQSDVLLHLCLSRNHQSLVKILVLEVDSVAQEHYAPLVSLLHEASEPVWTAFLEGLSVTYACKLMLSLMIARPDAMQTFDRIKAQYQATLTLFAKSQAQSALLVHSNVFQQALTRMIVLERCLRELALSWREMKLNSQEAQLNPAYSLAPDLDLTLVRHHQSLLREAGFPIPLMVARVFNQAEASSQALRPEVLRALHGQLLKLKQAANSHWLDDWSQDVPEPLQSNALQAMEAWVTPVYYWQEADWEINEAENVAHEYQALLSLFELARHEQALNIHAPSRPDVRQLNS